jgi:hypothetical protein
MFKIAAILAISATAVSITASTAEAGARGLMTGLFIGAVGAHMIDQSYRAERRREAYESERLRRERAIAARRAEERAAEYRRIRLEEASAARIAAEDAADDAAEDAADAGLTDPQAASATPQDGERTSVASKGDLIMTAPTPANTTTATTVTTTAQITTVSSTDTTIAPTCRKYSPATDSMIDTRCP